MKESVKVNKMSDFDKKMKQYAKLLIEAGVNIQKGDTLVIHSPVELQELVHLCTEAAYQAGAKEVVVGWKDDFVERQRYLYADDEVIDTFNEMERQVYVQGLGEGKAMLEFYCGDPDKMNGVSMERFVRARRARMSQIGKYNDLLGKNIARQCTTAPPLHYGAEKVYPDLDKETALEKMWENIFVAMRIDGEHDPVEQWQQRFGEMERQCKVLNSLKLKSLHYTNSLGTDLEIKLIDRHIWDYCLEETVSGIKYFMNIPSEEIYSVPRRDGVNGKVVGSIPLVYQGNLIENYWLRFEDGAVVDFAAEKGEDSLRALLSVDEGAKHLGEVALVPKSSAIRKSGILFLDPLYDENASCHLALGTGVPMCVEGGMTMTDEELKEAEFNTSAIHVDFMIGTDDLSIVGTTADGEEIPIFVDGDFAQNLFG